MKEDWEPARQAEFDVLKEGHISNKDILENIKVAEQTAGMNLDQYKKTISERKAKNYSIVQLKMWGALSRKWINFRKGQTEIRILTRCSLKLGQDYCFHSLRQLQGPAQ